MKRICQEWQLLLVVVGILCALTAQRSGAQVQKGLCDSTHLKKNTAITGFKKAF